MDSRSSSVVPEWDSRIRDSAHNKLVPALVGRCIRRGKRPADVRWGWALPGLYLRRLRPKRDGPVVRRDVPDNATFRVE